VKGTLQEPVPPARASGGGKGGGREEQSTSFKEESQLWAKKNSKLGNENRTLKPVMGKPQAVWWG